MRSAIVPVLCAAATCGGATPPSQAEKDAQAIIAVERGAFERWAKGDLGGFLAASDDTVNYFDPFLDARLDGLAALRELYSKSQGTFTVEKWEMLNPKVLVSGDMAVLTFNFASHMKGGIERWNTTEVYQRKNGAWKIIHTHWSLTKPELAKKPADM